MLSVRRGQARTGAGDAREVFDLATGRSGTGRVVATTGIRGLGEEDLRSAKFSETEIARAESFATTREEARQFAAQGKLAPRRVNELARRASGAPDFDAFWALIGFSEDEELAIGRQAAGNILGAAALVDDPALQQYVNRVGRWIASQTERPDLPWVFGVIQSDDLNAFAAPGGYVFVTRGLYRGLQTESELAGVLAHEIGHVIKQHHLKILRESLIVDIGGKVLTRTLGGESEPIKVLIGNGAEIFARRLDQDAEFEADRTAVVLAARAGYDPFGLPTVLQDLGRVANDDSRIALLFKTHPHPDDRLARLGDAVGGRLDALKGLTLERRLYRLRP
jgi:predicted Zn-dependent protease